jgi:hypothetical protein
MLSHIDNIMLGLTENMDTDSIYLDYAKAFDKVDHELLLQKLQKYGFGSQIINWVKSFLCDRKQSVVVNGIHSIISSKLQSSVVCPKGQFWVHCYSSCSSTIFKIVSHIQGSASLQTTPELASIFPVSKM